MASMNFPANPTAGQEYVWEDFIYVWDGEKWSTKVTVGTATYVKKTGDTMTGDLTIATGASTGQLKLGSNNQTYISGDSAGDFLLNVGNGKVIIKSLEAPVVRVGSTDHVIYHQGFKPTASEVGAVSKTGDTMTGNLTAPMVVVTGTPTNPTDVATKAYVDANGGGGGVEGDYLPLTGGTLTGNLTAPMVIVTGTPTNPTDVATKEYVDANIGSGGGGEGGDYLPITGGDLTGPLSAPSVMAISGTTSIKMDIDSFGQARLMAGNSASNGQHWLRISGENGDPLNDLRIITAANITPIVDWPAADHKIYHEGFKPTPAVIGAVAKAGDTMTGNLTAPKVLLSAAQGTEVNAVTRKDYVDAGLLVKADSERVTILENTITSLLARIEALEAQANPGLVM